MLLIMGTANGKRRIPDSLKRTERMQVTVSARDLADLERIGDAWQVPASTALWALAAGRLAELRGERMTMAGGDLVKAVSRYLAGVGQDEGDLAEDPEG